jgi:heme/copper-type cytochrome/quinol oxidase subunit 1
MKEKLRKILAQMFLTHLGRLFFVAAPLMLIGGLMSPYGSIGQYLDYKKDFTGWDVMMIIGAGILVVEFFWMMYYAVKNTIGDIKEWWKRKKK